MTVDKDLATLRETLDYMERITLALGRGERTERLSGARAAHARVEAELSRLREDRDWQWDKHIEWHRRAEAAEARCARLQQALTRTQEVQPRTLERLRANKVVFDSAPGPELSDWQNIAFWIYTDLCETEQIAREALARPDTPADRFSGRGYCECEARGLSGQDECLYDDPCLAADSQEDKT